MPTTRAEIATPSGAKLIHRLCKHWAHKLKVEHEGAYGRVEFDKGVCLMTAEEEQLNVVIEASDEASLTRLEEVAASHLERMANQETLEIVWHR
ncbi:MULTISPECIES: DUF2218 domain-containing protein [Halomonadaceae]|uniref:DUF2218 domain-containing protein n=1 Tax=Halomonadaceae TaxID=28256 RepID=UPI00159B0BAE|nr:MULTISPECIES: DUF2218 domain-containing protein [Halomonas]QJQ95418.1 DUF2218 domain-containing protein [Halomonas sp. PA5]